MKLWTKVIIMNTVITLSIIVALTISLNYFFNHSFTKLESDNMNQNLQRIGSIVQTRVGEISGTCLDWAQWDDSYVFMTGNNQSYIDSNLSSQTFVYNNVNVIAYVSNSNTIVWARYSDLNSDVEIPISQDLQKYLTDGALAASIYDNSGFQGILRLDEGPMLFAAQPILTSTGEGPTHGFLLMGSYLGASTIKEFSSVLQTPLTVSTISGTAGTSGNISPKTLTSIKMTADKIVGNLLVNDSAGQPYLVLSIGLPRTIHNEGLQAIGWFTIIMVALMLAVSLISLWVARDWILKRFRHLETSVIGIARQKDYSMRVPEIKTDLEIGQLGHAINRLLDGISEAQVALKESEAKYSAIVENMSEGVVIIEDGIHKYANKRVAEIEGLTIDEILGKSFIEWIAPEYRDAAQAAYYARIAGGDAPPWYRTKVVHADGHLIPVELSARVVEINGKKNDIVVLHDTTEREEMEQALHESEARYRMLAENSGDVIWLMNLSNFRIEYVSPSVERTFGYTPEEFCSLTFQQILTPDSIELAMKKLPDFIREAEKNRKGELRSEAFAHVHKNGARIPAEVVINVVFGANGKVTHLQGITRDISARKKAEAELRKYELISNNSRDIILFLGLEDGRIIEANYAATLAYGFTREDLLGKTIYDLRAPFTRESIKPQIEEANEQGILLETIHQRRDGTFFAVEVSSRGAEVGGSRKLVSVIRDITARKKAEEQLSFHANVLQNVHDGVIVLDRQRHITYWNDGMAAISEYGSHEMLGKTLEGPASGLTSEKMADFFNIATEHHDWKSEWEYVTKSGRTVWVTTCIGLMKDGSGQITGFIVMVKDITSHKQTEAELLAKTAFLEAQLNSSIDAVLVVDEEGRRILQNQRMNEIFHVPASINESKDDAPLLQHVTSQTKHPEQFIEKVHYLYAHPTDISRDEIELKDGTIMDRYSAPVIGTDGKYYGRIWTFRDITATKKTEDALRESERQLSEIIQFLPDATLAINLKGEVVAWNRVMENMTGILASDMLGKGNHEYAIPFYGERRPILIDLLMQPEEDVTNRYTSIVRSGDAVIGEAHLPRFRGEEVYLSAAASILRNSKNEIVGAIESIRDITERKKTEDFVKTSLREKETLLKEIQHRVKNNMQVISSMLEMQSNCVKDQADARLFHESQQRIGTLSLVYNKLYKSNDLANISLKDYVTELVENLVCSYNLNCDQIETRIDIENISMGVDLAIPCGLIINEIVVNSLKYAFKDGRRGLIMVNIFKKEYGDIEMDISDNGVGLPDKVDVRNSQTLGMGLVYTLAEEQLNGRIEIIRTSGTAYRITFNSGKS